MIRDAKGLTEEEFLAQYDGSRYPKPSVTADVVMINDHNEVLLIQRGGHPYLGRYAFPGGFSNPNERIEHVAARELEEETGITGVDLSLIGIYSKPGRDPRGWTMSAAYLAKVRKEDVHPKAADDAADARWFLLDKDRETLVSGDISLTFDNLAFDHMDILRDALNQL